MVVEHSTDNPNIEGSNAAAGTGSKKMAWWLELWTLGWSGNSSTTLLPPIVIYNNDLTSIIDIYFYETFSTLTQTFSACAQLFRHPVWC